MKKNLEHFAYTILGCVVGLILVGIAWAAVDVTFHNVTITGTCTGCIPGTPIGPGTVPLNSLAAPTGNFGMNNFGFFALGELLGNSTSTGQWNSWTGIGTNPTISNFSVNSVYNIKAYGAKCDNQRIINGALTGNILTSVSIPFVAGDVGKIIAVAGAGPSVTVGGDTFNSTLISTVASYQNAGQVTLTNSATNNVTGAVVNWGTDDTTPINTAKTAWQITGGTLFFPLGACAYNGQFTLSTFYTSILQGVGQARPASTSQIGSQIVVYGGTTVASLGAGGQVLLPATQNLTVRDLIFASANAAADTTVNVSSATSEGLVYFQNVGIGGATDGHEVGLFVGNLDTAGFDKVNYFGGLRMAASHPATGAGFLNNVQFSRGSTNVLATGDTANFQFDLEGQMQTVIVGPGISFEVGPNFVKAGNGALAQAITVEGNWIGDNVPSTCKNWAPSTAYTTGQCVLPLATRPITTNFDITSGAATLTSHDATNIFTQADIGRIVIVNGAGANGNALVTTISAVGATPTNSATTTANAGTTVTSATGTIIGGYNGHIYVAASSFTSAANEVTWCLTSKCVTADVGNWNETGPGAGILANAHGVAVEKNFITAVNGTGILDQSVGGKIEANAFGGGTDASVGISEQGTGATAKSNSFDNFATGSDEIRVGSTTSTTTGGTNIVLQTNGHRNDTTVNNNYSFLPSSNGDLIQPSTSGNAKITNRTGLNADGAPGAWNERLAGTDSVGYMQQFGTSGTMALLSAQMTPVKFANCPIACNAGHEGAFCSVNDDNTACAFGATVTGSGTHHALAICNGTNYVMATCQ